MPDIWAELQMRIGGRWWHQNTRRAAQSGVISRTTRGHIMKYGRADDRQRFERSSCYAQTEGLYASRLLACSEMSSTDVFWVDASSSLDQCNLIVIAEPNDGLMRVDTWVLQVYDYVEQKLPQGYRIKSCTVRVPGVNAERSVVRLKPQFAWPEMVAAVGVTFGTAIWYAVGSMSINPARPASGLWDAVMAAFLTRWLIPRTRKVVYSDAA